MAVQSSPVLPQTPKLNLTQFSTTSTAGAFVTLYTGGTNGSKITGISATNSSTQSITVRLAAVSSAGTNMVVNSALLTTPAGFDGIVSPGNLMSNLVFPVDGDGQPYLFLTSSLQSVSVTITSSIQTASGVVNVIAIGSDF